jgi:hypothetical protein
MVVHSVWASISVAVFIKWLAAIGDTSDLLHFYGQILSWPHSLVSDESGGGGGGVGVKLTVTMHLVPRSVMRGLTSAHSARLHGAVINLS